MGYGRCCDHNNEKFDYPSEKRHVHFADSSKMRRIRTDYEDGDKRKKATDRECVCPRYFFSQSYAGMFKFGMGTIYQSIVFDITN